MFLLKVLCLLNIHCKKPSIKKWFERTIPFIKKVFENASITHRELRCNSWTKPTHLTLYVFFCFVFLLQRINYRWSNIKWEILIVMLPDLYNHIKQFADSPRVWIRKTHSYEHCLYINFALPPPTDTYHPSSLNFTFKLVFKLCSWLRIFTKCIFS